MDHCTSHNCHCEKPCECLDSLSKAMAYVPWQTFQEHFDLCKALYVGTLFPELCKPFCGKRGCKS